MLGHDLRNPLASIDAGTRLLLKTSHDAKAAGILIMVQSSVGRMSGLIDNLLDFARGRLGGGLSLDRSSEPLEPALLQVINELRANHPQRRICIDIDLNRPVICDRARIAQLLSNLVANALTHGSSTSIVRVVARTEGETFVLSVVNDGDPIPAAALERLFKPFERGAVRAGQQGLGLGLFICAEIARAHGGDLVATSTAEETVSSFEFLQVSDFINCQ